MKRLVFLTLCLVLVFSIGAIANEGNPYDQLTEEVPTYAKIGPYASVMAQRLAYDHSEEVWQWKNFLGFPFPVLKGIEHYWVDTHEPAMDFGEYSGRAGQGKFTDSNGFVVETNTSLKLTFSGTPLKHTEFDDVMLTTYWAWTAHGVDGQTFPVPAWRFFPKQVLPQTEIGYFGEGQLPRKVGGAEVVNLPYDVIMAILMGLGSGHFWPEASLVEQVQEWNGITTNGIYAFQVFGFASTDEISSQREGDYVGSIILTVSK